MRLKVRKYIITASILLGAPVFAADVSDKTNKSVGVSEDKVWTTVVDMDAGYTSWKSSRGYPTSINEVRGKGSQFYAPFGINVSGTPGTDLKYEFQVRSGYAFSKQATPYQSGSIATLTDTTLQTTVTYLAINGIAPFISININAPTGQSALYGLSRFAKMDSDLVDITHFGEGWNFGPSLGANIPVTDDFLITVGLGYTYRGEFVRETDDGSELFLDRLKMKPGNDITANISATYTIDTISLNSGVSYSTESKTYSNGQENFKSGDKYTFTASVSNSWNDVWSSTLSGSYIVAMKNENLPTGQPSLVLEAYNSNNRILNLSFSHIWSKDNWSIGPNLSYLNREKNGYDSLTYSYISAKEKFSSGASVKYKANDHSTISLKLDRIWTNENDYPLSTTPHVKSNAWLARIGAALSY
jgi:hypothetical protein